MSKPDEAMKNQCIKDMMKNVDNSVENAIRFAYNKGYKDAKREGTEGLFNGDGCPVIEIQKGHARFGNAIVRGKHVFLISTCENEADVGSFPEDDPTEKPLIGIVIRDAEHARVFAESFERMADCMEQMEAEADDESDDDFISDCEDLHKLKKSLLKTLAVIESEIAKEEMKNADQDD